MAFLCSMKILLVAATAFEVEETLQKIDGGLLPHVQPLIAGVGAVPTVFALLQAMQFQAPDLVVQAGIGGAYTNELDLAQVVLVKQDRFADLGALENGSFSDLFDMQLALPNEAPFERGWLVNDHPLLKTLPFENVKALTVNTVTDDRAVIDAQIAKYQPEVESMEGAALHYACLQMGKPFLQLRAISNLVGVRNKTAWKMAEAIGALNAALGEVFSSRSGSWHTNRN
jgi:futalosine hydrolase